MGKRTLWNCTIIKQALANGKRRPEICLGMCKGYLNIKGTPYPKCARCRLNYDNRIDAVEERKHRK